jgi:argininosuccinate lyase
MTAQLSKKSEAWSARFSEPVSDLVKRYTASVFFDKRLAEVDIQGSLAHAEMLAHQRIIKPQDLADIQRGLQQIQQEIAAGKFEWLLDLEDVHLNIEARLTQLVGDAGKRLHTCAAQSMISGSCCATCARPCSTWPSSMPTPSCPALPTCRWPSQ